MTTKTLTDLTALSSLASDDLLLVRDTSASVDKSTQITDINTYVNGAAVATHAAVTATHGATGAIVGTTNTQTLTNKTLTAPVIATISNTGTLTLPTSTDTLVGRATTDTLTNKTLTAPVIATISNTGTLTLPTSTDTLVGRATTDTLTNKTLTAPIVASVQPASDSTTAFRVFKADGSTAVGTWDTTNAFFGIGKTPGVPLDVTGSNSTIAQFARSGQATLSIMSGTNQLGSGIGGANISSSTSTFINAATSGIIAFGINQSEKIRFDTNGNIGIGVASVTARLHVAGNLSQSSWTTNGIQLQAAAATYTDSSTATSGTAATAVFNSFAQPTLAATNATVTTTRAATIYIANAPTAGTNQTITNAYALWIDNGAARFDGNMGFFATEPVAQQTSGANLTNNVTSGGTDDTIANFTDLTIYANDAAAIRNAVYQLSRKLKQINDGLRSYGLFT